MQTQLLAALLATTALATAQSPLTTTFANNNQGSPGGAIYFELKSLQTAGVTIPDIDLNCAGVAGNAVDIEIYLQELVPGVACDPLGAWIGPIYRGSGVTAGAGNPTNFPLTPAISLDPSCCYCMAVVAVGFGHTYTTGTPPFPLVYSTAELQLTACCATNAPFTAPIFIPRVVNIRLNYIPQGACPSLATCTPQGMGCTLTPVSLPLELKCTERPIQEAAPNAIDVTTCNIGPNTVFHLGILGLSRPGAPLAAIGFPVDCFLWASPDVINTSIFLPPPAPPTFTWTAFTIPAFPPGPYLRGFVLNAQAITLELGPPLLGPTSRASNGLKFVIGDL